MPVTSDEILFPGGVTIEHDALLKAIKAGKSPEECAAVATADYKPVEVSAAPEAAAEAPAAPDTSEKE